MTKLEVISNEVHVEAWKAQQAHEPMNSLHEALAVIEEEMHELRMEVYKNANKHPDRTKLARAEAIQVAAMATRLVHDLCD